MKRTVKFLVCAGLLLLSGAAWAVIPEDTAENSYEARIVKAFTASSELIDKGLTEVRETLSTSGALLSVEAKSEFTEGDDLLDEIVAWSRMFSATLSKDTIPYKKIRSLLLEKQGAVKRLADLVGATTSEVNGVIRLKKEIKSIDKKILFQFKQIKGKMKLIPNKPLPAEAEK